MQAGQLIHEEERQSQFWGRSSDKLRGRRTIWRSIAESSNASPRQVRQFSAIATSVAPGTHLAQVWIGTTLIKTAPEGLRSAPNHSHSIVAGGLLLTSYVTRLMPRTSLMMRLETFFNNA